MGNAGTGGAGVDQIVWSCVLVVLLIFVTAFFALAEYSLITVRRTRIRQLVEEGNRAAVLVERLLNQPTRFMATIQTGITLVATLSSAIAATAGVSPLARWIATQYPHLGGSAQTIALILVVLPVTVFTLVVGEIAPKSLAVGNPEKLALVAVYPISWLRVVLTPAVWLLTLLSNGVLRPFGGTASFVGPAINQEELKMMVEASEEQGVLEAEETEMIHSILDFGDTVARKVMTPRIDITALDVATPVPEIIHAIADSGHSRIPLYEGDLDSIVGIVHAKDVLNLAIAAAPGSADIRAIMRAAYFVPETKKIDELLTELQVRKEQIAVVRDEYGITSGLVTIEDIVEEIVGDIQDEYDVEEPPEIRVEAGATILDGRMSLNDVNDRTGLSLPLDAADTIGGFVFGLLGHQAEPGEEASWDSVRFEVEATDGRRITRVRMHQQPAAGDEAQGVAAGTGNASGPDGAADENATQHRTAQR